MMKELIRSGLEQLGLTPSIPAQAPEQLAQYCWRVAGFPEGPLLTWGLERAFPAWR